MFSSQQHIHLSVEERSRSKSLPASPCSPKVYPKTLGESLCKGRADLPKSMENDQSNEDKLCSSENRLDVLKRQEEQYISSCESAQTVCDSLMLPDCIRITEPSKEDFGQSDMSLEITTDDSGKVTPCESAGEVFLQRPHILKGISSSRKGQSNIASFGLAFPSTGSLSSTSWTDVSEKKNSEEWGSFPFSPVFDLTCRDSGQVDGRYHFLFLLV